MIRHLLTINGTVEFEKAAGDLDFDGDGGTPTTIMSVDCSPGDTVVNVVLFWTRTGTTISYDFFVEHVSGTTSGASLEKIMAADTR